MTAREIKFRVWDSKLNQYTDDRYDIVISLDGCVCNDGDRYDYYGDIVTDWKYYILEQYTGLKDKNGVEIYEGDIYQFQFMQESYKGVIVYDENRFCIKMTDLVGDYYENINTKLIKGHFGTIVGNIHEVDNE